MPEPAVIVTRTYDLVLWIFPKVETFPRSYRHQLGDRIVTSAMDLLLALVRSAYSTDKARLLESASQETNTLRYLLRLAKDLRVLNVDSYGFASAQIEEIGRMLGGWQKQVARRAPPS